MRSKTAASLRYRLERLPRISRFAWCGLVCLLGGMNPGVRGAESSTNRAPAQVKVTFPQSVFLSEGPTGKDPFFPSSVRRIKRDDTGSQQQPTRDFSSLLKLTGIAGGVRPIATINNLTFAAGEEQDVKVEGGKVKIRVLEIREKSVVVITERQPQPIELKLRDVNLKFDE